MVSSSLIPRPSHACKHFVACTTQPVLVTNARAWVYCMKPCKMKVPNCALFSIAHIVCYIFPLENIVLEILLRIHCNKPVKVLLTLVHCGKYCTWMWSRGKYTSPRAILASRPCPCAIFPIVHLLRYFN